MARQDKNIMCRCGCGERKTSRKKNFVAGHSQTNRLMNICREVEFDFLRAARAKRR
jgi:hypothetical protein